jgi:hypothetical protein
VYIVLPQRLVLNAVVMRVIIVNMVLMILSAKPLLLITIAILHHTLVGVGVMYINFYKRLL